MTDDRFITIAYGPGRQVLGVFEDFDEGIRASKAAFTEADLAVDDPEYKFEGRVGYYRLYSTSDSLK